MKGGIWPKFTVETTLFPLLLLTEVEFATGELANVFKLEEDEEYKENDDCCCCCCWER